MRVLSPEVLATIKTPCCGVPYKDVKCSRCNENYYQDLYPLDYYLSHRRTLFVDSEGYYRAKDGYLHSMLKRMCTVCKVEFFSRHSRANKCEFHAYIKKIPETPHERFIIEAIKKCRRCSKEKPLMEFKSGNGFMGRQSNCRACYEIIKMERER